MGAPVVVVVVDDTGLWSRKGAIVGEKWLWQGKWLKEYRWRCRLW